MGLDYLVDKELNADDLIKIFEIFIKNGYDLNKRNSNQHSLLYNFSVDSIKPNPKIIQFLIDNGAKMNHELETKDDFLKLANRKALKKVILDNIDSM